jgi:hypothetical protein
MSCSFACTYSFVTSGIQTCIWRTFCASSEYAYVERKHFAPTLEYAPYNRYRVIG